MGQLTLVTALFEYHAGKTRVLAKRIKHPFDTAALDEAAGEMCVAVPSGAILIPAPSSSGDNAATFQLASRIAMIVGGTVVEAIRRRTPLRSSHLSRVAGVEPPTVAEQIDSMERTSEPLPDGPVVLIDNVITTGNTLVAMAYHLEVDAAAVVYASASGSRAQRTNPSEPIRVCICGSRGYTHLERVEAFVHTLPDDAVVVHGGALGVDEHAGEVAAARGLVVEVHAAEWARHGRGAGPIRNRSMIPTCDYLVAFWDGRSRGTCDAIAVAIKDDVEYEVIPDVEAC